MAATDTPTPLGVRDRWVTAGLLGIGLVTFAISASTTNLILSELMTAMRVELYHIHWVVTANSIARTITIPALGWLSGRFGPRTLYLLCLGLFTVGSLGSALAWDWTSLLFFRILTGAGGGMIPPLSMAIFYQIFPPHQRGMALGLSLMGWSIGPSIGPLSGGYLLEFASWRVIYFMIVPLSALGVGLTWLFLPPLRRPDRRRLDVYGLCAVAVMIITFLVALSQGRREGWDSSYIQILLAIATVSAVAFVIIEFCHPEPLVELRLFRSPQFIMAVSVMCLTTMAFRSTGPMFPVLMQRMLGFEPLLVAWTMLPSQIIYGLCVFWVGRLSDRLAPQLLVVGGLLLYASTFMHFSGITIWTTAWTMTTFLTFRFIAEAFIVSPNNLSALRALPEHQVMMASGLIGLARSISNTLGPALSAVFWDQRYERHLQILGENSPADSFGFTGAVREFTNSLTWMGEIAALVPVKTMALLGRLFRDEASVLAWQDYILFNGLVVLVALLPALLTEVRFWRPAQATADVPEDDAESAVQDVPNEAESSPRVEADMRSPAPSRI